MAEGWRFWILLPGEHLLRSPYGHPIAWTGPNFDAVCSVDP